jgi:dolichyl-phosphate-mannose--protein O-mannosyl transferase/Gpi18-like mannosyltransferase
MTVRPITKWILAAIALVGLLLRLAYITNDGFHNDVQAFMSWSLTAAQQPLSQFYDRAGFADYPPGYLYVLAVIGHIWTAFFQHTDGSYSVLRVLVKLPAILCDLLIGLLLFNLTRRFVSTNWALGIAAFYILNPVTILISGLWGQVESVGGSLALLTIYLLIAARDDENPPSWFIPVAWLSLSASILMKPEAAILLPLLVAYAFVDRDRGPQRLKGSLIGAGASLLLALIVTLPFHPTLNLIDAFRWLFDRYSYGTSIYKVSSVNAFNLWSIKTAFWQNDSLLILWLPQWIWGMGLTLAATALIVWRYAQAKTSRALLESAALLTLAFFMLNTRMHERYIFDGFLFVIVAAAFAWRYRIAAIVLTITFFANLEYSLFYLKVMDQHLQLNSMDLWGFGDHALSFVNVAVFFVLGYTFLGGDVLSIPVDAAVTPPAPSPLAELTRGRTWFDPTEGLQSFRPLDYVVAGALGIASFVLSFVNYWLPNEKVFDEIYFARAGEEYLKHIPVYETTHPPLTKLIIAGSMLLFGGTHGLGDTPWGWRFIDVVCGALVVVLLYAFARRVTGSTVFAAIAAAFLMLDGMHFVQSRIATPEGIVVVFSLGAVYAFYRFWIASQVNQRAREDENNAIGAIAAAIGSLLVGLGGSALIDGWAFHQSTASAVVIGLYAAVGLYLFARLLVLPRLISTGEREVSYGEGSYAVRAADGSSVLYAVDGGVVDSRSKTVRRGASSQSKANGLVYDQGELEIAYARDASVTYKTPIGSAVYTPETIVAGGDSQRGRDTTFWLLMFTISLGCLVASKWYGVMGFGVSFVVLALVWLQRFLAPKPRLWGNPRGFRLDIALCTIAFVAATVYGLVYVPEFVRQLDIKTPTDMVYRQYSMFEYHDKLVATHPYSSEWWQWPLDARPIAYYYHDGRKDKSDPKAGPVSEVLSLPNPEILWFGLLTVPFVGFLAWQRRNKAYALIVLTYLLQWLPWMRSPRITFAYHFYVDIPLICLCNAIALQWVWEYWKDRGPEARWIAGGAIGLYIALVAATFVFFYPVLAGVGIPWNWWDARMWHMFLGSGWV